MEGRLRPTHHRIDTAEGGEEGEGGGGLPAFPSFDVLEATVEEGECLIADGVKGVECP